jgi:hypothetical protein
MYFDWTMLEGKELRGYEACKKGGNRQKRTKNAQDRSPFEA